MTRWNVLVLSALAVAGAACNGQSDELSRGAQIYVATINDVVGTQPAVEEPDELPVVYVVAVGENTIAADVQAEVASELRDEVDVRFADDRDEAVEADVDGKPVRDHGVLVAVGELAPDVEPVSLDVEVYRSERDWSKAVLTFADGSAGWVITSTSVVPES